jgi:hypothetical protein
MRLTTRTVLDVVGYGLLSLVPHGSEGTLETHVADAVRYVFLGTCNRIDVRDGGDCVRVECDRSDAGVVTEYLTNCGFDVV